MADLIDKAILLGLGLEKKLKETLEEAQSSREEAAKASESKEGAEGTKPLTTRQIIENRVVEDGSAVLKELLTVVVSAKEKIESEIISNSARVADKLHVATDIEMDVVKEMARIAREKVDSLEARVEELEKKAGKE
jgi:BMFP domain-containing protein YqiC